MMGSPLEPFNVFRSIEGRDRLIAVVFVMLVTGAFILINPAHAALYVIWIWSGIGLARLITGQSFSIQEAERFGDLPSYVPVLLVLSLLTAIFAGVAIFAPEVLAYAGGIVLATVVFVVVARILMDL